MKGITKDHESITKDYESLFYSMKDQCKKNFALHLRPYILIPQYWSGVSCIYDIIAEFNCLVKSSTFTILFRKSPAFTTALIISRYDICTCSIYSLIIFKEMKF